VLPMRVLGDPSSLNYVADGLVEALSAKLFSYTTCIRRRSRRCKRPAGNSLSDVARQLS